MEGDTWVRVVPWLGSPGAAFHEAASAWSTPAGNSIPRYLAGVSSQAQPYLVMLLETELGPLASKAGVSPKAYAGLPDYSSSGVFRVWLPEYVPLVPGWQGVASVSHQPCPLYLPSLHLNPSGQDSLVVPAEKIKER